MLYFDGILYSTLGLGVFYIIVYLESLELFYGGCRYLARKSDEL